MSTEEATPLPRPTRKDVAALANVSGTTVSRVLGGRADESISPRARDRVLKAARELGYAPNPAAKALRSGRTGLIAFWMCLEYSLYRSRVLAEMRSLLAPTDYALAVTDVDEDYAWHRSIDRALRVPAEGIVALDATTAAYAFLEESDRLAPNVPFVSMGASWSDRRSYVGVDLRWGAEAAVRHLLETGRRRIAYLVPQGTWFVDAGDRFEGYRDAVEAAGYAPQTIAVPDVPQTRVAAIAEALAELKTKGSLPDALLCFYDDMAVDAAPALQSLGLEPGEDVALVGFNGQEGLDRLPVPLSTVRQPIERMCALAYEFLSAQIEDPTAPPKQVLLRPELIVRASSAR